METAQLRRSTLVLAAGSALCGLAGGADAADLVLAANDQVLQAWQQGGGEAPALVQQSDGNTTIQWTGGVSLDVYRNSVTGTNTTTALRQGNFYKATAQGDLRSTQASGDMHYLQFSVSTTDDTSVISHAPGTQINSLQMGFAGTGYQVALGDVAASFSSLGTNLGLRGLLAQKQFGQSTISATAGVLADSWESLSNMVDATRYTRNVYAAKLETPVTTNSKAYVTVQGYNDVASSLTAGATTLAPASGRLATAGFAYQLDQFGIQGEAGTSHWNGTGQSAQDDRAYIVDVNWNFQSVSLRAGHHDIGKYYASLAAQGGNGVKETYLNGNWLAKDWLNLTADLRRSENNLVAVTTPPTSTATRTDAATLGATITFGPEHPGWALMLNQTQSLGENSDGSGNRNRSYGATMSYSDMIWNGTLGFMRGTVKNNAAQSSDATTRTWQMTVGRNWSDTSPSGMPVWTAGVNLGLSRQEQTLASGGGPSTTTWQVGMTGQRASWGSLTASYLEGTISGQTGGGDLRQKGWQLEATHPFKGQNSVKLYVRDNRTTGSTTGADYKEQVTGVQLVYVY
jgi:hypothetical protein